jgi:hypothetical protein
MPREFQLSFQDQTFAFTLRFEGGIRNCHSVIMTTARVNELSKSHQPHAVQWNSLMNVLSSFACACSKPFHLH